jgi:hypothetical protein
VCAPSAMYTVLNTAPLLVLKRPTNTDWPAIKVHTSTIQESPAPFRGKFIILDFSHNAVLETASPLALKLKLSVDWPATKVAALSWRIYRFQASRHSTGWLLGGSQTVASIEFLVPATHE